MKEYGFQLVPGSRAYAMFDEVVQLEQFSKVKGGRLARQVNDDIIQLVQLTARKGGDYSFAWGISLSYVPHDWRDRCKFHRTLKAARFDLFEEPAEFLEPDWDDLADCLHGEVCFRSDLETAWRKRREYITNWMASTVSLDEIATKALGQINRKWKGPRHFPDPRLVYAFTIARLHRLEEANRMLDSLIALNNETYSQSALRECLNEVSAAHN